jgi:hypothetical protein
MKESEKLLMKNFKSALATREIKRHNWSNIIFHSVDLN